MTCLHPGDGLRPAPPVIHMPGDAGPGSPAVPGAVIGARGPVTSVDTSPSCPQGCAQAGESRRGPGRVHRPRSGGTPSSSRLSTGVDKPVDQRRRHLCVAPRTAAGHLGPPGGRRPWGRTVGKGGTGRGRTAAPVNNSAVVHVSTPGTGSSHTASPQVDSGADLHERPRSPASTRVMTRMRELSRGILEQHSGWGRPAGRAPRAVGNCSRQGTSRV